MPTLSSFLAPVAPSPHYFDQDPNHRMQITEHTTVKDLLSRHPEAFPVLQRHGMCADCQDDPPPVPLGQFANKHCGGNFLGLLREIRDALSPVV